MKEVIAACHSVSHEVRVESGPGVRVPKIEWAKCGGCSGHKKMSSTVIKSVLSPTNMSLNAVCMTYFVTFKVKS